MRSRRSTHPRGGIKVGCMIAAAVGVMLLVITAFTMVGRYNSLVGMQETTEAAWSEIDNQYKRRFDLIPQLVATVKGAADFEKSTLEAVTEARASVGRAQLPPGLPDDPAQLQNYIQAQQGLGSALGRLFVVVERYPELKASRRFGRLQDDLSEIEDNLQNARRYYNAVVRDLNTALAKFPNLLVTRFFAFRRRDFFELDSPLERQVVAIDIDNEE